MARKIKNVLVCILVASSIFSTNTIVFAGTGFSDVPIGHWSSSYILKLKELGITNGIGDGKFGFGKTITRAEFVTFLSNMLNLELVNMDLKAGSFEDNKETSAWYYSYVETALQKGIIDKEVYFRPNENITREEIAVMLVRSLGYNEMAKELDKLGSPFADVTAKMGYITIAKDFGFVNGTSETTFTPHSPATREEAATMMIKMYESLNRKIEETNAFYAINSFEQSDLIGEFDNVSFGWSKLEINQNDEVVLNSTSDNNNEYRIPEGFETPISKVNGSKLLMVSVNDLESMKIINQPTKRTSSANVIAKSINSGLQKNSKTINFDGVVIDFETLKGESTKKNFNLFLSDLKIKLGKDKKIFVAVHPAIYNNQYFDGYDFKTISEIADKVILMAHDYNAKSLTDEEMNQGVVMTPLTPISDIYYALKAITNNKTGVQDKSKIMLQINFATAQWKIKDDKVINQTPFTPNYETLISRIKGGVESKYSTKFENPYITYFNQTDSTQNVIWYEDARSLKEKAELAKLFDVRGISLWRLGNIPNEDDKYNLNVMEVLKSLK